MSGTRRSTRSWLDPHSGSGDVTDPLFRCPTVRSGHSRPPSPAPWRSPSSRSRGRSMLHHLDARGELDRPHHQQPRRPIGPTSASATPPTVWQSAISAPAATRILVFYYRHDRRAAPATTSSRSRGMTRERRHVLVLVRGLRSRDLDCPLVLGGRLSGIIECRRRGRGHTAPAWRVRARARARARTRVMGHPPCEGAADCEWPDLLRVCDEPVQRPQE